MSVLKESQKERYDVIVVGSGMGGLSAAALLARADKSVLVVERHDRAGGYAHAFQRKQFKFDAAIHLIGGCRGDTDPPGLIDGLLQVLGVRDQVTFIPVDPFYALSFPDFLLSVPTGMQAFVEAHTRRFPSEAEGIRDFAALCSGLAREIRGIPERMGLWRMLTFPKRFPLTARHHRATVAQVLDRHVEDPRARAALGGFWPYLGLPPSRLSFLYFALALMSFIEEGAYLCEGTFQNVVDALVRALRARGGELMLRTEARRILTEGGKAVGVMLENGQRIAAPVVISNADALQTFEELLGAEQVNGRYLARLRRMEPSLSAVVAYLGTGLDLRAAGVSHETFQYERWEHDAMYESALRGQPEVMAVTVPTLADPSIAPAGQHEVVLTTLAPYRVAESWREAKEPFVERLIARAEAVIPGLGAGLTFTEGATPRTMERYTLNFTGAMYGWAMTPEQSGRKRLARETPIEGLYLAGHWTQPGLGLYGVTVSGVLTAARILGHDSIDAVLRSA